MDKVVDQIVRELAPSSSRRKNEDPDLMSDLRRGNLFLTKVVNNLDKEDGRGYTISVENLISRMLDDVGKK